jgi:hypothetical protein
VGAPWGPRCHPSDLDEVDEKKLSRRTGGSVQVWRPQQNETGDWCLTHDPISLEARVPVVAFPMRFSMHTPARYVPPQTRSSQGARAPRIPLKQLRNKLTIPRRAQKSTKRGETQAEEGMWLKHKHYANHHHMHCRRLSYTVRAGTCP